MRLLRGCVVLLALGLATAQPTAAFTIHSRIALVADDAQVASLLHASLGRRFRNVAVRESLAQVEAEAGREGAAEVAIVVATSRERGVTEAYGSSLPVCHVMVTAQVLRLPGAVLELSRSAAGKGPDCAAALEQVESELADELLRSLEEYRRRGAAADKEYLWFELVDDWPDTELAKLRSELLAIPGIRRAAPESDAHLLKVEVYRDPRSLAREVDRLESVRVARLAGRRITLSAVGAAAAAFGGGGVGPAASSLERRPPALPPRITSGVSRVPAREVRSRPPAGAAQSLAAGGQRWALVVGISRFKDASIPTLTYPAKDASAFAGVLTHPAMGGFAPGNVVVVLDQHATTRRIKMELDYLARMTRPEDLFLFFVSTHAAPGEVDVAGDAYLVTHDTEKASLYATGFPMRELVDALSERIRAQTVVGFLDACYTGQVVNRRSDSFAGAKSLTYEAEPDDARLSWSQEWQALSSKSLGVAPAAVRGAAEVAGKRVVLISSSDGNQPSWESEILGHGFFTYYLMEALKRAQGPATARALFDYLKAEVKRAVLAEKGRVQEPRMFFTGDADFPIGFGVPGQ